MALYVFLGCDFNDFNALVAVEMPPEVFYIQRWDRVD